MRTNSLSVSPRPISLAREVVVLLRQTGPLRREQLQPHFPADVTPEQLQKALENAAFQGQIENIPDPAPGLNDCEDAKTRRGLWRFIEEPMAADAEPVPLVVAALSARSDIEIAWSGFYSPRNSTYRSAAA